MKFMEKNEDKKHNKNMKFQNESLSILKCSVADAHAHAHCMSTLHCAVD